MSSKVMLIGRWTKGEGPMDVGEEDASRRLGVGVVVLDSEDVYEVEIRILLIVHEVTVSSSLSTLCLLQRTDLVCTICRYLFYPLSFSQFQFSSVITEHRYPPVFSRMDRTTKGTR